MQFTFLMLISVTCLYSADTPQSYSGFKQLHTDHFTLIYEPQDQLYAYELSTYADETLKEVAHLVGHTPREKIPVILTSRPPFANGYFSPLPSKIVLFLTSPHQRFLGSRSPSWLKSVFTHELTHYVHLTHPTGLASILSPLFGKELLSLNSGLMPLWWIEGLSTYSESHLAEGGRGFSQLFSLPYTSLVAHNEMWKLSQGMYHSAYPPSSRAYQTGFLMIDYLINTYGESAFQQINKRFTWWPFFGLSPHTKKVVGLSSNEVFHQALRSLTLQHPPESIDKKSFSPLTIGNYYLPYPTQQGLIGIASTLDRGNHALKYDDSGAYPITKSLFSLGELNGTPSYDGKSLYFTHMWNDYAHPSSFDSVLVGYSDLYRYDIQTQSYTSLTSQKRLYHPSISRDNEHLVAIEHNDGAYRLVEVSQKTGAIHTIYAPKNAMVYEPNFSSDGLSIVVIEEQEGNSTLTIIPSLGEWYHLWDPTEVELHSPRFIDNNRILFSADFDGPLALYIADLTTKVVYKVFSDDQGVAGGVIHNDELIYSTYAPGGWTLYETPLTSLSYTNIDISPPSYKEAYLSFSSEIEESNYIDWPRFNFWLPVYEGEDLLSTIGATTFLSSLLGRHSLLISGGYNFTKNTLTTDVQYINSYGPFTTRFTIQADAYHQSFTLQSHAFAWVDSQPTYTQSISIAALIGVFIDQQDVGFGIVARGGYSLFTSYGPKDYFGRSQFGFFIEPKLSLYPDNELLLFYPTFHLNGQLPLGRSHHVVSLETTWDITPLMLSPSYVVEREDLIVELKASYHIPLGVYDIPVVYGGIVGSGLSFSVKKDFSISDNVHSWGEDTIIGVKGEIEYAIGSSLRFRPFVELKYHVASEQVEVKLSLNLDLPITSLAMKSSLR